MSYIVPEQTFDGFAIPEIPFYDIGSGIDIGTRSSDSAVYTVTSSAPGVYLALMHDINQGGTVTTILAASKTSGARVSISTGGWWFNVNDSRTINGETVYYGYLNFVWGANMLVSVGEYDPNLYRLLPDRWGWLMVYGGYIGYSITYDLVNCIGSSENPTIIPPNAIITPVRFTPDTSFVFNSGSVWVDGSGFEGAPIQYTWDSETGLLRIGIVTSNITVHAHAYIDPYNDPNNPDLINGESDIPGGDTISIPGLPGISAVSSGVIGLFNPSVQQMQLLSDFMWTDFGGTATTTDDILKEIVQAIKRTISNPLDYIVGLNIIPSQGLSVGSSFNVRFGFVSSGVSMPRLLTQYFVVDCGTLSFDKLCGDTFLDYAPYSKFTLYLPYIGVKEMDANDFVGHTIGIVYHGDVVTGGITAYVLKDGSVMYQYAGCCALTVPINADSWGNVISGAVQIATSIVAGGIMAGGAGATIATAKGAADVASNPSMLSPQVLRSGAVSGGAGCMAVQKPFVIREAVRFHSTNGFNTVSGYPSYYYKTLSEMHGFTSVLDVHLHGIPATDGEIAEIESLLKEGVIL